MFALLLVLLQDRATADPDSLLAARRLPEARRVAEHWITQRPDEPAAHPALGRVWQAWPTVGRYQALAEFRTAERLAPDDTAPLWGQVEGGYRLGGDEGEAIARAALIRLLEVRPGDDAAWQRFLELYHDDAVWRRADRALALHPDDPAAALRWGVIAVALEEPARADSLATGVLARGGPDVSAWLLRAAASFQLGRDSTGYAWYDSALAHADIDSSGALWDNVRLIATPDEAARFAAVGPGDARRFFLWFWGKRDPNLVTPWNERIAEHFRRLAYARRHFHLLHPLSLYHRSATARGLAAAGLRSLQRQFVAVEPQLVPVASERLALATGLGPEPRDAADQPGERSIYGLTGLDARGLVWLGRGAGHRPGAVARQRSARTLRLRTRRRLGRRAGPDPRRGDGPPFHARAWADALEPDPGSDRQQRRPRGGARGRSRGSGLPRGGVARRIRRDLRPRGGRARGGPLSGAVQLRPGAVVGRAPARHPSSRRLRIHTGDAGDGRHTGATRARPAADVAGALPCNAGRDGRRAKCQGGVGGGRDHRPLRHACLPRGGFPNWDRPLHARQSRAGIPGGPGRARSRRGIPRVLRPARARPRELLAQLRARP